MRIAGKVVVITGGSEGIGAACAAAFRSKGAHLVLTARNREKLEAVGGADALIVPGDIKDPATRVRIVDEALARHGRIDVLINNAGVGMYSPSWRAPMDSVRDMFELNVFSLLELTQLVVPRMREQRGGMIVNLSSIAGKVPLPWFTAYSASKYALCALSDGLRMELKDDNIRVMTVCPGYVRTGFQRNVLAGEPPERVWRARRFAITAEHCAQAILRGVENESRTIVTPRIGWVLIAMQRLFPRLVEWQLRRYYNGLDRKGLNLPE